MKSITRAVHLSSVVQSEFYGATRILFVHKENKNNSLSLLVRIAPFWILPIERKQRTLFCICFNARMRILRLFTLWFELKYRILALRRMQKNVRCLLKYLYSLKSFFCLMLQALLINIWQLSAICLLSSSPLKLGQVGWGQTHIFMFLQKYLIGFKLRLWLGHSRTFTWVVYKLFLLCA